MVKKKKENLKIVLDIVIKSSLPKTNTQDISPNMRTLKSFFAVFIKILFRAEGERAFHPPPSFPERKKNAKKI